MTLVLLPGMDGTGMLFENFIASLGSHFNVQIVRYPTTVPMNYAELELHARNALPTDEPFVLLGESFSGPIAISLAESCSSQLKGLILCCSFARNPQPIFGGFEFLARLLPLSNIPKSVLSYFLLGQFSTRALQAALFQAVSQVSPSVMRARIKAVLTIDVSAKLASLPVPVLYLQASRDRVVPSGASKFVAQLNPRTQVVQIEAPHLLLQSASSQAAEIVCSFLRSVQNAH